MFFCCFSFVFSQAQLADGVLAHVGPNIVLYSTVLEEAFFQAQREGVDPQQNPDVFRDIFNSVLREKVRNNIVLLAAEKDSTIEVSLDEVRKNLNERISYYIQELGSKDALEKEMGMSLGDVKSKYSKDVEEDLLSSKLRFKLFQNVDISRHEVFSFYEQNKDSLPKIPAVGSFSVVEKKVVVSDSSLVFFKKSLNALRDSLVDGFLDFSEVAIKRSADPSSALNRGFTTTKKGDSFSSEYEKASFLLEKGDISPPVLTSLGYHLIKLVDRVGEKTTTQHILFNPAPSLLDFKKTSTSLDSVLVFCNNDPGLFDSLAFSFRDQKNMSGAYSGVELSFFPPFFVEKLKTQEDNSFSDVFLGGSSYYLIYKYYLEEEKISTLKENWVEIEGMAINKKRESLFDRWIEREFSKTYVKINPIY